MRGPAACSTAWHSGRLCRGRWLWLPFGIHRWLLRGAPSRGRRCRDCNEFPDPRLRRPSRRVPRGILQILLSAGPIRRQLRRVPWLALPVSQRQRRDRARLRAASTHPCQADRSLSPDPKGNPRKKMHFHSRARRRALFLWVRALPEPGSSRLLPSSAKSAPGPTFRGLAQQAPARSPTRNPVRVRNRVLGAAAWAKQPAAVPVQVPAPRQPLGRVPEAAMRSILRPAVIPGAEQRFPGPAEYPGLLEHLLVKRAPQRKFPPAGWSSLPDRRCRWAPQLPVSRCHRSGPLGPRAAATHRESAPRFHLPALTRATPLLPRSMEQRLSERAMDLLP